MDGEHVVAEGSGLANIGPFSIGPIPDAKLWSPESPFLYNLTVTYTTRQRQQQQQQQQQQLLLLQEGQVQEGQQGQGQSVVYDDVVQSYFGMREVSLCAVTEPTTTEKTEKTEAEEQEPKHAAASDAATGAAAAGGADDNSAATNNDENGSDGDGSAAAGGAGAAAGAATTTTTMRPCINGEYRFLAGVLDQSYFPDGQYTAPGKAALISDVAIVKEWGMNFIRLHQKTNPERWCVPHSHAVLCRAVPCRAVKLGLDTFE